ncbi:CMP deaminase [bacterium TMED181]|nr:MAG: CMP deaminase [bacterium TMED181]
MNDKWDIRYLKLAKEVSKWSKDPSVQVGAIAVGEIGQVLAQGYNGFPRGVKDDMSRYEDRETKYRYVVHAEANCIYNAAMNGVSLDGATMYVYGLPACNECAKALIQVGIKRIVMPDQQDVPEKWKHSCGESKDMLEEVGILYEFVKLPYMELVK